MSLKQILAAEKPERAARICITESRERRSRRRHTILLWNDGDPTIPQDESVLDVRHGDGCQTNLEQSLIGLRRLHEVAAKIPEQEIAALGAAFSLRRTRCNRHQNDARSEDLHLWPATALRGIASPE